MRNSVIFSQFSPLFLAPKALEMVETSTFRCFFSGLMAQLSEKARQLTTRLPTNQVSYIFILCLYSSAAKKKKWDNLRRSMNICIHLCYFPWKPRKNLVPVIHPSVPWKSCGINFIIRDPYTKIKNCPKNHENLKAGGLEIPPNPPEKQGQTPPIGRVQWFLGWWTYPGTRLLLHPVETRNLSQQGQSCQGDHLGYGTVQCSMRRLFT